MKKLIGGALLLSPVLAFAATTKGFNTEGREVGSLFDVINKLGDLMTAVTPFIIGLAVLVIIWGIFNYISGAGDEEKRAQAKQYIIWGVIGVFIMISIWGLVGILINTANIKSMTVTPPGVVPCPGGKPATFDQTSKMWTCLP